MLRPKSIVETAKTELGNIIITYLRKLDGFVSSGDKRLMTAPDQDIILEKDAMLGETPKIRVEVDNSYLDVEDVIYEYLPIDKFVLCEGEFYVEIAGTELTENELSVEELSKIAQFLQDEWEKCE